jgi:phosphatidylglycerol:prolipoprotein diacylglycerol transferase
VKLKPASFGSSQTISLSTSQFVAVTTGFAAALAFSVFHKAAVDHPEFAMALRLPPTAVDEDEDEDDALPKRATTDDDASRPQRSKKTRRSEVAKSARNASSKDHDATGETSDDPKARDSDAGA